MDGRTGVPRASPRQRPARGERSPFAPIPGPFPLTKIPLNISPIFYTDCSDGDKPVVNLLGADRTATQFGKYRSAVEAGCNVSLVADVPSAPLSIDAPLLSVESVITRRDPLDDDSKVFPPPARRASPWSRRSPP